MTEDDAFTDYIRITHNPDYEPVSKNTIKSEIFRVFEEQKQMLLFYHLYPIKLHSLLIVGKSLTVTIILLLLHILLILIGF